MGGDCARYSGCFFRIDGDCARDKGDCGLDPMGGGERIRDVGGGVGPVRGGGSLEITADGGGIGTEDGGGKARGAGDGG